MKKLVVCGDSFMTPVVGQYAGTHFSELLAQRLGSELVVYSRGGMSNGGIALQVEAAIRQRPDLILVGTTFGDRIEFPLVASNRTDPISVEDILYQVPATSLSCSGNLYSSKPRLASEPLRSQPFEYTAQYDSDHTRRQYALRLWFEYLYHDGWKVQQDRWIIYAVLHQLHCSGIPYLICFERGISVYSSVPWFDSSCYAVPRVEQSIVEFSHGLEFEDPGYHSHPRSQARIAEVLYDEFIDLLI